MLKLGKGLKKKKKNKKGKKEEELFTEEELEKYRQEHAHKVEEGAGASEEGTPTPKPSSNEEFEKFKLLTAGVDDILRKSQGDLDRIKKESFFQRKPTPSELKAAEEAERLEREKSEGNWVAFEEKRTEEEVQQTEVRAEEESESEYEDNDDIFDTAYVDALESGEIKLAHVPDDDELGLNDGPDPFDTSTADELLRKAEEQERKKKKEISLGLAVNVLSGRAERDKELLDDAAETKAVKQVRARPRKIQDFCLLGSFDESTKEEKPSETSTVEVGEVAPLSLLDEEVSGDIELSEGDVLFKEVLVKQFVKPPGSGFATPEENSDQVTDLKELVTEFELGPSAAELEIKKLEEEEEFDEFSALAASSVINQKLEEELEQFEAVDDDPFDTTGAEDVLRVEPDPFNSIEHETKSLPVHIPQGPATPWSAFDQEPKELDPFDTGFVDECVPGKVELRLIEKEILEASIPEIVAKKVDIHLEARILSRNNSEDFNPRAGEDRANNQRVSIHITNPSGETQRGSESEEIVALNLSHRDLLGGSTSDLSTVGDQPLPPSTQSQSAEHTQYSDPFDTSVADQAIAPGRAELKFIENELLSDIREITEPTEEDDDFDPRAGDKKGVSFDIPSPIAPDLLASVKEEAGTRPLTPYYAEVTGIESDVDIEIDDPFDTSHVTSLPGKQELKLIEQELDQAPAQPAVFQPIHLKLGIVPDVVEGGLKHSISDQDFNPREEGPKLDIVQPVAIRRFSDISGLNRPPQTLPLRSSLSEDKPDLLVVEEEIGEKALTPAVEDDISSYIDPFDTTIAENIAPGKAELKVLEVELVGSLTRSYTDEDFNPRDAIAPTIPEGKLKAVPSTQPLQPIEVVEEEIDPFDTSFASNIGPGKTELRLLESELVG